MTEVLYDTGAAASLDDLLAVQDMPVVTVAVPRWAKDGTALRLQVRGPSLPQQVQIGQKSRRKDLLTGEVVRDRVAFAAQTLAACVISPKLDEAQATLIVKSKNPAIVEALVSFCWNDLLDVSMEHIERIVHSLSGMPDEQTDDDRSDPDGDIS